MYVDQAFPADTSGRASLYIGAVVFGQQLKQGCEVLRILTPMPETEMLYRELARVHTSRQCSRLVLTGWNKTDLMEALQAFCRQGTPLPDIFDDSHAIVEGISVFQTACYREACSIPHGETRSYGWLAGRLKKYGAERAVGGAMRANPFPLLIPCHRVVKKDGSLGGFIGASNPGSWQLGLKKTLLEIEGLHRQPSLFALPAEVINAFPMATAN